MENVVENNKLIAEFIGFKSTNNPVLFDMRNQEFKNFNGTFCISYSEVYFDMSWDWLIPVLDKIKESGYKPRIISRESWQVFILDKNGARISEQWDDDLHKATYNVIISFIKFYNNQNK